MEPPIPAAMKASGVQKVHALGSNDHRHLNCKPVLRPSGRRFGQGGLNEQHNFV